jgi:hypothetical protein
MNRARALFPASAALVVTVGLAAALAGAPIAAATEACPNEAIRAQQHATYLLDCRAYEKVSPAEKNNGDIEPGGAWSGGGVDQAALGGEAITYIGQGSFAEAQGALANQYLSTRRGGEGWSTQNIMIPALAGTGGVAGKGTLYKAFSSDLALGLVLNGLPRSEEPIENPPLAPGAPGYQNFYLRDSAEGSYRALLTFTPEREAHGFYMDLEGASADLGHVVVSSQAALTPGALEEGFGPNLYEWNEGELAAVNVLPGVSDGETRPQSELGSGGGESHAVSEDGSRVFWAPTLSNQLYVRKNAGQPQSPLDGEGNCTVPTFACTLQLDAPQGGEALPGELTSTVFQTASADGSVAFFTSQAPLTADANTGPPPSCGTCARQGKDLYRFDTGSGQLSDLTPDAADANGAEVQGVLGASEDGTSLYFVAAAVLAGPNAEGHSPTPGGNNLYRWHEDPNTHATTIAFVASGVGGSDISPQIRLRTSRVTPSGGAVAFSSSAPLTGYDNKDANTGKPDQEVFVYDAAAEALSCASCNPSGERPIGSSSLQGGVPFELRAHGAAVYQPHVLADSGARLFFDSSDAIEGSESLIGRDTNGAPDVYEWEAEGEGACNRPGGCASLISGGSDHEASELIDASANGSDVFFLTRQELVGGDIDQLVDLYDARTSGGFAEPPPPPPCTGDACQGAPQAPPGAQSPGSAGFSGSGNPPAHLGHARRKHKHGKTHKHKRRAAKHSRGGSK